MIEQLTDFPSNVGAFVCKGWVTKSDYDAVLVPAFLNALRTHDNVRLYYETDADFASFDLGAAWKDLKIGMGHFTRWDRVAVVTDIEWSKHMTRFFGFLMLGTMVKLFSRSDATQARDWIRAN